MRIKSQRNAEVCLEFNQREKARVWELLSLVSTETSSEDACDGWGRPCHSALSRKLVTRLIDFYECSGDVQMLATMVCVLSGGVSGVKGRGDGDGDGDGDRKPEDDDDDNSLLPLHKKTNFDRYITQYSKLLHSWECLSTKTELLKHLIVIADNDKDEVGGDEEGAPDSNSKVTSRTSTEDNVSFVGLCMRCFAPCTEKDLLCNDCGDYVFRCSLCDRSVRGAATYCLRCGHGGHSNHMNAWFLNNDMCPSGCGCICVGGSDGEGGDGKGLKGEVTKEVIGSDGKVVTKAAVEECQLAEDLKTAALAIEIKYKNCEFKFYKHHTGWLKERKCDTIRFNSAK